MMANYDNINVSTDPADWTLDPDTGEYVTVVDASSAGNHNADYQGIVLGSLDDTGQADVIFDAYMIGAFNEISDFAAWSDTVTQSSWIPVGTDLTDIDQSSPISGSGDATVRWDAPDINTPVVTYGDGLGESGTASPVCFCADSEIQMLHGEVADQSLRVGDFVITRDRGPQPIRWIGSKTFTSPYFLAHYRKFTRKIITRHLKNNRALATAGEMVC